MTNDPFVLLKFRLLIPQIVILRVLQVHNQKINYHFVEVFLATFF